MAAAAVADGSVVDGGDGDDPDILIYLELSGWRYALSVSTLKLVAAAAAFGGDDDWSFGTDDGGDADKFWDVIGTSSIVS